MSDANVNDLEKSMSKKERRRRRRSFDRPRRVSGLFCILQLTIGTASLLLSSCFIGIADANVVPSARQGQEGGCQVCGMGSAVGGGEDQFAHSQPPSSCRLHGRSEAHGEPSEGAMVDPGTYDMGLAQNSSNSNKSGEEEAGGRGGKGGDDVEKKPVRRRWKNYICSHPGCHSIGKFGDPDAKTITVLFCSKHKMPGADTNMRLRKCLACGAPASYGSPTDLVRRYCAKHRREGDIDLKGRLCSMGGCLRYAVFGERGGRPAACKEHMGKGMVLVKTSRCKYTEGCDNWAGFGDPGIAKGPRYCMIHKAPQHIDLHNKKQDKRRTGGRGGGESIGGLCGTSETVHTLGQRSHDPDAVCHVPSLLGEKSGFV